jgi:hypothetical protein
MTGGNSEEPPHALSNTATEQTAAPKKNLTKDIETISTLKIEDAIETKDTFSDLPNHSPKLIAAANTPFSNRNVAAQRLWHWHPNVRAIRAGLATRTHFGPRLLDQRS